jgi:hypothetical protein
MTSARNLRHICCRAPRICRIVASFQKCYNTSTMIHTSAITHWLFSSNSMADSHSPDIGGTAGGPQMTTHRFCMMPPPRRTDANSEDLLEWVSRNTLRAIEEALPIWARQGAVFATFEGQPESARKHSVKRRRQTRRQGGSSMSPHSKSHLTAFFFPTLPKGELHPYVPANLRDDKGP